jgi:hypothetical protein
VGAVVSGGIAPYSYQIIGSEPTAPSINSSTQSSPIFTINNGAQYSLVRLRAVDGCGNATLNDVSILPLANTIVTATSNCIYQATTLSTDIVPNAVYSWYKKSDMSSTDSVMLGTGPTYSIPAISVADTGIYISRMSVNSSCLTRLSYFHLDGLCDGLFLLPTAVVLRGKPLTESSNELSWTVTDENNAMTYALERLDNNTGIYTAVTTIAGDPSKNTAQYNYTDYTNGSGTYFYRLKMIGLQGRISYSNVVMIKAFAGESLTVYPNPVHNIFYIAAPENEGLRLTISLFNIPGQLIYSGSFNVQNGSIGIPRSSHIKSGIYFLRVYDSQRGTTNVFKLIFK